MAAYIRVMATGIIALCLLLAAVLSLSSVAYPTLKGVADQFFLLGVLLIMTVIVLAAAGIKVKFP